MARPLFSTYLYRQPRSSHFFFRIRIPKWLRRVVRSRELRYTLQTADLTEAKYRAMRLAKAAKTLFARGRKGEIMGELTKETLDRMMQEELKKMLEEAEADRAAMVVPWTRERLESQEYATWALEGDARENLALNDYREIGSHVEEFLRENGIEGVEKGSETYGKLCRELLKVRIRFFKIEQRRLVGDYSDDLGEDQSRRPSVSRSGGLVVSQPAVVDVPPIQETPAHAPQQVHALGKSVLLSEVIQEYAAERKRGGNWKPKTELENMTSFSLLKEVLGDIPVAGITGATMREFKQTLMKLPPNMRKSPQYRDKSIKEILGMGVTKCMDTTTINKQLDRASSLFNYAVDNGYMDRNPAQRLQIKAKKRPDQYRAVFAPEDLKKIFHYPDYLNDTHKYSYRFWLPVIALYTGMRINEICQLGLDDVHIDDGVYVFDVREKKDETDTKTPAGERLVPLHDFLVADLNLPGYVEMLRGKGETRLFPELKKKRDGYGAAATRWFSTYRKKCGIVDGPEGKKHFHSFRHTVTNFIKQVIRPEDIMSKEFMGHSTGGSETYGRYGKRYSSRLLKEQIVDQLKFEVDLSHLKRSRFVVH